MDNPSYVDTEQQDVEVGGGAASGASADSFEQTIRERDEIKKNIKLIYCGNGVISEDEVGAVFDSFDEPLSKTVEKCISNINPKEAPWHKFLGYYTIFALVQLIVVCEYLGEKLARFFGIMDSKYSYAVDEYFDQMRRERDLDHALEMEPEIVSGKGKSFSKEKVKNSTLE